LSEVTHAPASARAPAGSLLALARAYGTTVFVAAAVFVVAYNNGGYSESTRDTLAIGVWWLLILAVVLGVWPLVRIPPAALVCGGLLAGFGLLTLFSVLWASDAGAAYAEFTRVLLYVGVFGLVVAATRRDNAGSWCDGLALGIVGVAVVTLISRFFPGTFGGREIEQLLPSAAARLTFPVGYWNGLAILLALSVPLLLRMAVSARNVVVAGLALVPIPAIAVAIFLASSRTGVIAAVLGPVVFIAMTARRWAAAAALAVAVGGSVATILAVRNRDALVDGPLNTPLASSQGHSAALIVLGICALVGLIYAVGGRVFAGQRPPSRAFGWILAGVAALLLVGAAIAAHPVRRFHEFQSSGLSLESNNAIRSHLLSASGNGRWQLWGSAIDEFETRPMVGRGAGSFESWWLRHGSLPLFVKDAHSLYAETLGELGIVGFLLLVGAFLGGLVVAARRRFRTEERESINLAAATGAFVAFAVSAAADWMWELTIVGVVGIVCLALMVGPATAPAFKPRLVRAAEGLPLRTRLRRYGLVGAIGIAGWFVICAVAIPLLSGTRLADSRAAVARGDFGAAVAGARDARAIEPWSSAPYLQLALVEERAENYAAAHKWIRSALARAPSDWRLWVIRGRIEAELGHVAQSTHSLARAKALNPHSPIFAG
jgi:FtsH-binding integral membrane protein